MFQVPTVEFGYIMSYICYIYVYLSCSFSTNIIDLNKKK